MVYCGFRHNINYYMVSIIYRMTLAPWTARVSSSYYIFYSFIVTFDHQEFSSVGVSSYLVRQWFYILLPLLFVVALAETLPVDASQREAEGSSWNQHADHQGPPPPLPADPPPVNTPPPPPHVPTPQKVVGTPEKPIRQDLARRSFISGSAKWVTSSSHGLFCILVHLHILIVNRKLFFSLFSCIPNPNNNWIIAKKQRS